MSPILLLPLSAYSVLPSLPSRLLPFPSASSTHPLESPSASRLLPSTVNVGILVWLDVCELGTSGQVMGHGHQIWDLWLQSLCLFGSGLETQLQTWAQLCRASRNPRAWTRSGTDRCQISPF